MAIELDYMEYANDAAAQATYVTNATEAVIISFQSGGNSSGSECIWGDTGNNDYTTATKIVTTEPITCTSYSLYVDNIIGTPDADSTLRIETDDSTKPSGTLVHANATNTFTTPTDDTWEKIDFTPFILPAGTYWAVISLPAQGLNNYISNYGKGGGGTNTRGYSTDGGTNWTIDNFAPYFRLYGISLQSWSEDTIKTQGSYALKGVATITDSLNKTLTRTIV